MLHFYLDWLAIIELPLKNIQQGQLSLTAKLCVNLPHIFNNSIWKAMESASTPRENSSSIRRLLSILVNRAQTDSIVSSSYSTKAESSQHNSLASRNHNAHSWLRAKLSTITTSWCPTSSLSLMPSLMAKQLKNYKNRKFPNNCWSIKNSLEIGHHSVYYSLESSMHSNVDNCLLCMSIVHRLKDFCGKLIVTINGESNSEKCWPRRWEKCLKIIK